MRLVVEALLASLPALSSVLLFGAFQFSIFGILGTQLFAGRFAVCNQVEIPGVGGGAATPITRKSQVGLVCAVCVWWWGVAKSRRGYI